MAFTREVSLCLDIQRSIFVWSRRIEEGGLPIQFIRCIWVWKIQLSAIQYTLYLANFGEEGDGSGQILLLSLEEFVQFLSLTFALMSLGTMSLKHGETLGYTEDQKLKITVSKGSVRFGRQTLKLEM